MMKSGFMSMSMSAMMTGSSPIMSPDIRPCAVSTRTSSRILIRSLMVAEMLSRISDRLAPTWLEVTTAETRSPYQAAGALHHVAERLFQGHAEAHFTQNG
jgi:hypothetical protein